MPETRVEHTPLLHVRGLKVCFRRDNDLIIAVEGFDIDVHRGEIVCLLGESGSGKSTAGLSLLNLHMGRPGIVGGQIAFKGQDLLDGLDAFCRVEVSNGLPAVYKNERPWNRIFRKRTHPLRGREIGIVFQDAASSLTPFLTVGDQLREVIRQKENGRLSPAEVEDSALSWLHRAGMPAPREAMLAYPFQLSGGLCRRATLAIALSVEPALLVADEPTEGLDAATQIGILMLLKRLRHEVGQPGILLITHHLESAAILADHIAVMYAGRVVETAPARHFFSADAQAHHPYTSVFLAARQEGQAAVTRFPAFFNASGIDNRHIPSGCPFHPRCPHLSGLPDSGRRCQHEEPPAFDLGEGHRVRCWRFDTASPGHPETGTCA